MHDHLSTAHPRWGHELEGYYISQHALRRHDPALATYAHIERGGRLKIEPDDSAGVIQRHILRQHGLTLAGPAPHTLIDPIPPDDLRRATADIMRTWWSHKLTDPEQLHHNGYRVYAILTMCRTLYTLEHGTIVSKPAAGRWALTTLDPRYSTLIQHALNWENDRPMDGLPETLDLIRYTLERSQPFFLTPNP